MEVQKTYDYIRNGKHVHVKRSYVVKGTVGTKQSELEEYFKNHADTIRSKGKLSKVLEDYNESHSNKISYSMLYNKYVAMFGQRRKQKSKIDETPTKQTTEHEEINTDDKNNDHEEENNNDDKSD